MTTGVTQSHGVDWNSDDDEMPIEERVLTPAQKAEQHGLAAIRMASDAQASQSIPTTKKLYRSLSGQKLDSEKPALKSPSSKAGSPQAAALARRHSSSSLQRRRCSSEFHGISSERDFFNAIPFVDMPGREMHKTRAQSNELIVTHAFAIWIDKAKRIANETDQGNALLDIGIMALRCEKLSDAEAALKVIPLQEQKEILLCEMVLFLADQRKIDDAKRKTALIQTPEKKAHAQAAIAVAYMRNDELEQTSSLLSEIPGSMVIRQWVYQKIALRHIQNGAEERAQLIIDTKLNDVTVRSNMHLDLAEHYVRHGALDKADQCAELAFNEVTPRRWDRLKETLAAHYARARKPRKAFWTAVEVKAKPRKQEALNKVAIILMKEKLYEQAYAVALEIGDEGMAIASKVASAGNIDTTKDRDERFACFFRLGKEEE